MDKVRAGQPLAIRATTWNSMVDAAADFEERRRLGDPGGGRQHFTATDVIKVKNSSGADRRAGDILQLSSSLVTTLDAQHIWLDGVAPAAPLWTSYHGVLRQPTPNGLLGDLQVAGVCLAYVNVTDAAHRRCDVDAATYVLQSKHAGPYQILQQPSGTGEKWCVVLLGPKRPSTGIAKLTADLAAGATGTTSSAAATLQKRNTTSGALESAAQTITVRSWFATAFSTDDFLSVGQDDAGDWWLMTADCI